MFITYILEPLKMVLVSFFFSLHYFLAFDWQGCGIRYLFVNSRPSKRGVGYSPNSVIGLGFLNPSLIELFQAPSS